MNDVNVDELFDAFADEFAPSAPQEGLSHREERIIAGFADIVRFVETHRRLPQSDENADIFERLYAVRLQALRDSPECRELLQSHDTQNLLGGEIIAEGDGDVMSDEDLLRELQDMVEETDITDLTHVRTAQEREINAPDYVAQYKPCADFEHFAPLFLDTKQKLESGLLGSEKFSGLPIKTGDWFILGGQLAYVAEMGEKTRNKNGTYNARLRVIFDNKTESDLINRSLERALYRDQTGRRIVPIQPSLFGGEMEEEDLVSGTIYVLRSLSDHPLIQKHRELVHKIGVTGMKVERRLAKAVHDPTFLFADVEIVAQYKLANINRSKLETLLHRFFAKARLDITIEDRFGQPVKPQEWFLVPLQVIDDAVKKVIDGTIENSYYDPEQAKIVKA